MYTKYKMNLTPIMKKIIFLTILMLLSGLALQAQTHSVGGVVIDSVTNKPMEYIAVYFEKTSTGCVTTYNG